MRASARARKREDANGSGAMARGWIGCVDSQSWREAAFGESASHRHSHRSNARKRKMMGRVMPKTMSVTRAR
jgi:hypothetical protein